MAIAEEIELSFEWRGLNLAGSLHLPSGTGPHPAVLMAQGSGPADRDSDGYFGPIRQTFIERGLATFAFDKPGCGESAGDWRHYGLEDRAEQLVAALAPVRNHPAIRAERVGMWGHSQGGWLAQKLAGRQPELCFAVAGSAPTISVQQQILYDCEQTIRNQGFDEPSIRQALTLTRELRQAAVEGASFEAISAGLLTPAGLKSWYATYEPIDDDADWEHFGRLVREPHDPVSDLQQVNCPFLAVYGGLDALLPPWRGTKETGVALAAAASTDVAVVVFPAGNRRIQVQDTENFVDGYLDLLGDWTADRAH